MKTINTIAAVREHIATLKRQNKTIAIVPTMGNLHNGHLSLIKKARKHADVVIATLFINDMQFGVGEDFDTYPRTFETDRAALESLDTDLLFAPTSDEMYPEGPESTSCVKVETLDGVHCGKSRPCFFTGIATVVIKILNIIQPDTAFFGEKDFQQLCIMKKMVRDLNVPVEVVGVPTVREHDGLAMSSRNNYLSSHEREIAPLVHRTLCKVRQAIAEGNRNYAALQKGAINTFQKAGMKPDYFNIASSSTLKPADPLTDNNLVILAAATLGKTRLIDNITLVLPEKAQEKSCNILC